MGEKGNVTSEELVTAVAGTGAVVAGAGTQVTAVFEEAAGTVKDKILDKGADAGHRGRDREVEAAARRRRLGRPGRPELTGHGLEGPARLRARPWWRWRPGRRPTATTRRRAPTTPAPRRAAGSRASCSWGAGPWCSWRAPWCSRSPQSGEDGGTTPLAVAAAADPTSAAPSASEDPEPTPEEVLAGSVPTGKWKMVQTFKYSIQRDGQRSQSWSYDPITRTWKFPPADCTAAACSGSLRSSSGSTFEFTWDGKQLAVGERRSTEPRGQAGLRRPG